MRPVSNDDDADTCDIENTENTKNTDLLNEYGKLYKE